MGAATIDSYEALKYLENPCEETKEKVAKRYADLVWNSAIKYSKLDDVDDLVSIGYEGLFTALERYKPEQTEFVTYAKHYIDGLIKRYLRDKRNLIRKPAWFFEKMPTLLKSIEILNHKFGRMPTNEEIASHSKLSIYQVSQLMETYNNPKQTCNLQEARAVECGSKDHFKDLSDEELVVMGDVLKLIDKNAPAYSIAKLLDVSVDRAREIISIVRDMV